ncbi:MAG: 5'-3' exonuclease [Fimbriimonadales bacterium]
MTTQGPLLVVDGDNLAHRAYHTTPKTVLGADGKPINAIIGFFGMLLRVWEEEKPRGVFVAWDTLGVDTYRNKLWPPYQTGRVFDGEIVQQLDIFPALCREFGFGVCKSAGYEADDLMAAAACREVADGGTCLLYTTDRDAYQLVSQHVTILAPRPRTRELDRIGPLQVVERLGVLPEQVPDFKALSGDPSDKIPGARGVGPKSAATLLLSTARSSPRSQAGLPKMPNSCSCSARLCACAPTSPSNCPTIHRTGPPARKRCGCWARTRWRNASPRWPMARLSCFDCRRDWKRAMLPETAAADGPYEPLSLDGEEMIRAAPEVLDFESTLNTIKGDTGYEPREYRG